MDLRMLGRSGLKVSPFCLGGNVFGWTIDEKRSIELLNAFVGAGFNFIDTADVYSTWIPGHQGGESEAIIGNWMKSRRNRASVVIATKVGMEMRGQRGLAAGPAGEHRPPARGIRQRRAQPGAVTGGC